MRSSEVNAGRIWNEPYLETCCRSALHRLSLSGKAGRPAGCKDGPCLARLAGLGLAEACGEGRYGLTSAGSDWHGRMTNRGEAR
jgi:hypothetical protein